MILKKITPHKALSSYVESIWILDGSTGILDDLRVIAPNGKLKMLIPYIGSFSSHLDNQIIKHTPRLITLVGPTDIPIVINDIVATFVVGIIFKHEAAYKLFDFPLHNIYNKIYTIEDILSASGKILQNTIQETNTINEVILILQYFLIELANKINTKTDPILEYAIHTIKITDGALSIEQLSKKLGYSRRYLNMKFAEKFGIHPKRFASVCRFQKLYKQWAKHDANYSFNEDIYSHYFDQAHFIKEFKKFTGHTPLAFVKKGNEFGKIFS